MTTAALRTAAGAALLGSIPALLGCGPQVAAPPARTTVVVVHDAREQAPALGDLLRARLRAEAGDPADDEAVAHVLAAGRPGVETVDLEPRRPNGTIERGPRIGVLVDERLDELDRAVRRAGQDSRDTDLLRALDAASRTGDPTIVVLSAGLSTVDPLDLRVAGWDRDPRDLAAELKAAGALPDLAGREVVFGGLGRTTGAQPPLGVHEQRVLREIWLGLCTAAGGDCRVDDAVRTAAPAVSSLTPPVVDVPTVRTTRGVDGDTTVEVPSAVLFGPDSCTFYDRAAARTVLEPLATQLRDGQATVAISGRTAPVGSGTGIELAGCRARAAADLLRELGVPDTALSSVRGDGSLLDPPTAALDAHGHLDPTRLAALRRVVFTLTRKESR